MEPLLAASASDFLGQPVWLWLAFLGIVITPLVLYSLYRTRRGGGGPDGGVAVPVTEAGRA